MNEPRNRTPPHGLRSKLMKNVIKVLKRVEKLQEALDYCVDIVACDENYSASTDGILAAIYDSVNVIKRQTGELIDSVSIDDLGVNSNDVYPDQRPGA